MSARALETVTERYESVVYGSSEPETGGVEELFATVEELLSTPQQSSEGGGDAD